jgi:hypothetical protein
MATGEPVSWQRDEPSTSRYEVACAYVEVVDKVMASAGCRQARCEAHRQLRS